MSSENDHVIAAEVRPAPGHDAFTLIPRIGDILRTRYCVPGSVFLVEGIDSAPVSSSGRWQAVQLLLGDSELCVQALLSGPLQRFVETGEISVGCYVRVDKFEVRWGPLQNDGGEMVYLIVDDLVTVGWNDAYRALWESETGGTREEHEHDSTDEPLSLEVDAAKSPMQQADQGPSAEPSAKPTSDPRDNDVDKGNESEDEFDAFESRMSALRPPKRDEPARTSNNSSMPVALPRDWHDRRVPLKLTTLRSIPNLPYAQNWSCNVLAIVASLSPVEPSYLAPYRQRTARLADPSTAKQVHLTVFLDPEGFEPKVGSAVLLVGVKNHRFDGGSLKKYASDAAKTGGRDWWFQDPWDMGWCDVGGIKKWWAEVQRSLGAE